MWGWLKRVTTRKVELAEKQLEIVAQARELMGLMDLWRDFAGKSTEEIVTILMNIGLGHVEAIYWGQMKTQEGLRAKKAQLN